MKKIAFILIAAAFLHTAAHTQDTLSWGETPKTGYFYNDFPSEDTIFKTWSLEYEDRDIIAKYLYANDTLTVYGIAAAIFSPKYLDSLGITGVYLRRDETYDSCIEALRLYRADPGAPTQLGEDLTIHIIDTPMSYYWKMQKTTDSPFHPPTYWAPMPPLPIYERYFATPQTVVDSFYVAYTQTSYYLVHPLVASRVGFAPIGINPLVRKNPTWEEPQAKYSDSRWRYYVGDRAYWLCTLIFPILTPNPDSTGGGGTGGSEGGESGEGDDTLSIRQDDLLQRLVAVSPNPASGRARVTSSFGLTRIEVFSPDGRPLLDRPAEGLTSDLDLAAWPAGTYIIRIHTPMGTVSRRLVVR